MNEVRHDARNVISRAGACVVEFGPCGQDLAAGTRQRLEVLPDWLTTGGIYPLACLIAIGLHFRRGRERPAHRRHAVD